MAQYKLAHIDMKGNRGELHDLLNLTGAADDSAMRFICIQAKAGSLEGFTMSDAVVTESGSKPSWL